MSDGGEVTFHEQELAKLSSCVQGSYLSFLGMVIFPRELSFDICLGDAGGGSARCRTSRRKAFRCPSQKRRVHSRSASDSDKAAANEDTHSIAFIARLTIVKVRLKACYVGPFEGQCSLIC
jgi:hypothetical protein